MSSAGGEAPVPGAAVGRVFAAAPGIYDRSERGKLRLTGPQALWFCDQLISNQVVGLADGTGAEALLLTPHGKITTLVRVLHTGDEVLIDMEAGLAAGMASFFLGRVFATRVEITDVTGELGIVSVLGPATGEVVATALGPEAATLPGGHEHDSVRWGSVVLVRVTRPVPGIDLWMPRADVAATLGSLESAGCTVVSDDEYESVRVLGGVARDRVDFDEGYLPQEAALERAVHFAKGCYLGQEAVAMTQRGRVKRRLRHLRFEGPAGLGAVRYQAEEVGRVTSATAAEAPGYGVATVRTSVPLGERVEVTGAGGASSAAFVEELPGTVAGPRVPSARELREGLAGVARPRGAS